MRANVNNTSRKIIVTRTTMSLPLVFREFTMSLSGRPGFGCGAGDCAMEEIIGRAHRRGDGPASPCDSGGSFLSTSGSGASRIGRPGSAMRARIAAGLWTPRQYADNPEHPPLTDFCRGPCRLRRDPLVDGGARIVRIPAARRQV